MNRSDLTKAIGQEVALITQSWGRLTLGTEHARKVTVVDGPFDRFWSSADQAYGYAQGKGQLWKVTWTEDGYHRDGEPKERFVKSKELLAPWPEHEAERAAKRAERKASAERRALAEEENDAWNSYVTDALEVLGIDWPATRRPGAENVRIPVAVLEQLLAVASREPVPSGN